MGKCIYSTLNNFLLVLYTGKRKKNNKEAAVDVPLVEDLWPRKPLIPTTLILPSAQIPQLIDAHDDDGHHGPGDRRDDLANMELWMVCTSGAQVGAHAQVGGDKCPRFFISGGLFFKQSSSPVQGKTNWK